MDQPDNRTALNVLRGLASIVVVIYHLRYFSDFPWFEKMPWIKLGFMGVDFFFVLSGLIISHVYLQAMGDRRESYLHFLYLRIARIFPIHFLIMFAMLAVSILLNAKLGTLTDWLSLTFLYRQLLLPDGYVWNSPAWSVSAEMFAYAFIFPIIVQLAHGRDKTLAGGILALVGIGILGILYTDAGTLNATHGAGPLLRVSGCFLIGAGMHCLLVHKKIAEGWDYAIVTGAILLTFSIWLQSQFAILASICLIIAGAYLSNGRISVRMSGRYHFIFGEISFSLYMCHVPLLMLLSETAMQLGIDRGIAFCAFSLSCAVVLAWALYTYVEVPARTALRKLWTAGTSGALHQRSGLPSK